MNRELKPQIEATQAELLALIERYDTSLDLSQVRLALCRRPKKPDTSGNALQTTESERV